MENVETAEIVEEPKKKGRPKRTYAKSFVVHMDKELHDELPMLMFHYRTESISQAIRNVLEDRVKEIKKLQAELLITVTPITEPKENA